MIKIKQVIRFHSARFAFGCLFAAAAFAISVIVYGKLNAGLFFAVLFITAGTINIQDYEISPRLLGGIYALWLILTAFATLTLSQFCLNEVLPDKGLYVTVFGTMLIIFLYLLPCALTLKIRITTTIVSLILIVFTCLNYFVFIFRGSEIAPADILSVATAGNVAAEYVFFVPATMFYALSLSAAYFFASYALPSLEIKEKTKTRIICFVFAFACGIVMWVGGLSVKPLHWRQTGSVCNGYLFNFTILLRESFPQKPKNYSVKEVNQIASNYSTEQEKDRLYPDIIVVMDESFADLSILGSDLNTDSAITPYIDNLQKNTARGFTLSSVFGGGTPNSEYEFLTGNTFLFLPTGSIAYQQYIKKPCYSIARDLKNKGYTTVAMHQYLSSSWMREEIWPMLGFDECLFLEEFPQEDFLRGWGTDQEMFEKVAPYMRRRKRIQRNRFLCLQ